MNITAQKMKLSIKNFFSKCKLNVTFTEDILNVKLHFLCSVSCRFVTIYMFYTVLICFHLKKYPNEGYLIDIISVPQAQPREIYPIQNLAEISSFKLKQASFPTYCLRHDATIR